MRINEDFIDNIDSSEFDHNTEISSSIARLDVTAIACFETIPWKPRNIPEAFLKMVTQMRSLFLTVINKSSSISNSSEVVFTSAGDDDFWFYPDFPSYDKLSENVPFLFNVRLTQQFLQNSNRLFMKFSISLNGRPYPWKMLGAIMSALTVVSKKSGCNLEKLCFITDSEKENVVVSRASILKIISYNKRPLNVKQVRQLANLMYNDKMLVENIMKKYDSLGFPIEIYNWINLLKASDYAARFSYDETQDKLFLILKESNLYDFHHFGINIMFYTNTLKTVVKNKTPLMRIDGTLELDFSYQMVFSNEICEEFLKTFDTDINDLILTISKDDRFDTIDLRQFKINNLTIIKRNSTYNEKYKFPNVLYDKSKVKHVYEKEKREPI